MNRFLCLLTLLTVFAMSHGLIAQTPLEEAVDFHVKTTDGQTIILFDRLADGNIVVIDFFSTSCGPCQTYAPAFQSNYEKFGFNELNTFFMGINYNDDNHSVEFFDSIFGLTYPSVSGTQGGGNIVFEAFQINSWPTVIVITPDGLIHNQYVWPPTEQNVTDAVVAAGGILVGFSDQYGLTERGMDVFPNPVNSSDNITVVTDFPVLRYTISHLSGKQIATWEAQTKPQQKSFSLAALQLHPGMYLVTAYDINNHAVTAKFFVH